MKDILRVVESVSNEKGVSKEIIFEAVEAALAVAARKDVLSKDGVPESVEVRAVVDRDSGDYEVFRSWQVVTTVTDPNCELLPVDAEKLQAVAEADGVVWQKLEFMHLGRIFAQNARQVIVQRVREAERERVAEMYRGRIGQMLSGNVKRVDRGGVLVDLGNNAEGYIPRSEMIPREVKRVGDRVRCLLYEVNPEARGPQLQLSRIATKLLVALFHVEVPEIGEGLVEIISAVRDPGLRARIAVRTREPRIDPIGACVGMRGARVQSVTIELSGERVDIVQWDENPVQFVINAMVPADITSVLAYEDTQTMDVIVAEDNLSQAIGRNGQNVKLASELCGWRLNVISVEEAEKRGEEELVQLQTMFHERLVVDAEVANILAQEGFSSIEEVAYVPESELAAITEFDDTLVESLRQRARDDILLRALRTEISLLGATPPSPELLAVPGINEELAWRLSSRGIITLHDLAVQGIDDLLDLEIGLHEQQAQDLIMAAREPLLADDAPEDDKTVSDHA